MLTEQNIRDFRKTYKEKYESEHPNQFDEDKFISELFDFIKDKEGEIGEEVFNDWKEEVDGLYEQYIDLMNDGHQPSGDDLWM